MRAWVFAKRNLRELIRSPLSYIFCVGFPVMMLLLFQMISHFTGQTYWFEMYRLAPGICVFSFLFVMLFMALLVSRDRSTSFLTRLYTTRMNLPDFVFGYAVPGVFIGLAQAVLCYLTATILMLATGSHITAAGITGTYGYAYGEMAQVLTREMTVTWSGLLLSILGYLPVILLFVLLGIFFGCILNENAAPGVSSAILTVGGLMSGAWMPLETMGSFEKVCRFLPFYPAVDMGRALVIGDTLTFGRFGVALLTVCGYLLLAALLAVVAFRRQMWGD